MAITRINLGQVSDDGDAASKNVGTAAGTVCAGDDSRLSNSRTPTSHTHPLSELTQSSATTGQVAKWSGSAWAAADDTGGNTSAQVMARAILGT